MEPGKATYKSIDEYLFQFSPEIQGKLRALRKAIKESAPEAEETISYRMPAFALNGVLVYFAAFKSHIGFFPTASGVAAFKDELTGYRTSKGTIQFPLDKPLPLELVRRIVKYRVAENVKKAADKKK